MPGLWAVWIFRLSIVSLSAVVRLHPWDCEVWHDFNQKHRFAKKKVPPEVIAVRQRSTELQKQRSFREGELVQTREAVRALELELASPLYAGAGHAFWGEGTCMLLFESTWSVAFLDTWRTT